MRALPLHLPRVPTVNAETGPWRLEIDWCGRPVSANAWYGLHFRAKADLVAEWNGHAIAAARLAKLPKNVGPVAAEIQLRYRSGQLTDPDSAAPTWKAIMDGLVTYGLIPDDTAEWFRGVTLLPPFLNRDLPHAVIVAIYRVHPDEPVRTL